MILDRIKKSNAVLSFGKGGVSYSARVKEAELRDKDKEAKDITESIDRLLKRLKDELNGCYSKSFKCVRLDIYNTTGEIQNWHLIHSYEFSQSKK